MATNYLYIGTDNILTEIIPEFDTTFPGVEITARYSAEFLDACILRTDEQLASEDIQPGMRYDRDTDTFLMPPEPEPVPVPEPEPEGYTITEEEVGAAYKEGVNNVE